MSRKTLIPSRYDRIGYLLIKPEHIKAISRDAEERHGSPEERHGSPEERHGSPEPRHGSPDPEFRRQDQADSTPQLGDEEDAAAGTEPSERSPGDYRRSLSSPEPEPYRSSPDRPGLRLFKITAPMPRNPPDPGSIQWDGDLSNDETEGSVSPYPLPLRTLVYHHPQHDVEGGGDAPDDDRGARDEVVTPDKVVTPDEVVTPAPVFKPYGLFDFMFHIVSLGMFIADVGSDLYLSCTYYDDRHYYWFGFTIAFWLIPSIIMMCMSAKWQLDDARTRKKYWTQLDKKVTEGSGVTSDGPEPAAVTNGSGPVTGGPGSRPVGSGLVGATPSRRDVTDSEPVRVNTTVAEVQRMTAETVQLLRRWMVEGRGTFYWVMVCYTHVLQLAPIFRYVNTIYLGLKSRFHPHQQVKQHVYQEMMYSFCDVNFLRLFEAFMEAAPQLVLQLYIMATRNHADVLTTITCVTSLGSLCLVLASYHMVLRKSRPDKGDIGYMSVFVLCLWRVFTIGSRVLALAMFASQFTWGIFIFAGVHWAFMTYWLIRQETQFCKARSLQEWFFDALVGTIYIFCFFNMKEGMSRHRITAYYVIVYIENIGLVFFWYLYVDDSTWYRLPAVVFVAAAFFIGIFFMVIYYMFLHPSRTKFACCVLGKGSPDPADEDPPVVSAGEEHGSAEQTNHVNNDKNVHSTMVVMDESGQLAPMRTYIIPNSKSRPLSRYTDEQIQDVSKATTAPEYFM